MPNGHGGIARMGAPLFFAVLCLVALATRERLGTAAVAAAAVLAAIAGWRLAYHLHFWAADEYGGAYTSPEQYRRAALRYYGLGVVYAGAGAAAVLAIFW